MIDESISLVNHHLTRKGIKVVRLYSQVPRVKIDSNQMKQVFINLLMNAADAMDRGNITIHLDLVSEGERVQIRIRDEGGGIEKEHLKNVFDPFFTTKRQSGGTGLGLSITRGIIEKHKGDILIESEYGNGTTVMVNLPGQH